MSSAARDTDLAPWESINVPAHIGLAPLVAADIPARGAIERRVRSMMGFKSINSARAVPDGIEMVYMMRKQQAKYACNRRLPLAEQFTS
ncbi:hypothetical protein HB375_04795 [Microvirga sp. c23x22]|uniref:Transposase n=1 Tax=Microvirga terricola TaxID=2719797 RepID=A0ABX0V8N5_9HYPH|nr:hypothetical protein [Microvirga terricola]